MGTTIELLPSLLKISRYNEEFLESACFVAWNLVVGEANSKVSEPISLIDKVLQVATIDTQWQKQLRKLSQQILFRLNGMLGIPAVVRIEIIVNPKLIKKKTKDHQVINVDELPALDPDFLLATKVIEDLKLRKQFQQIARLYLGRKT